MVKLFRFSSGFDHHFHLSFNMSVVEHVALLLAHLRALLIIVAIIKLISVLLLSVIILITKCVLFLCCRHIFYMLKIRTLLLS